MVTPRNTCNFIGCLGADPIIRATQSGINVANFRISCNERLSNDEQGNKREITTWVNCVAWRSLADLVQKFVHKGDMISLMGPMRNREWTDKEGVKRYPTEIQAEAVEFIKRKNGNSNGENGHAEEMPPMPDESYLPPVQPGDIPF